MGEDTRQIITLEDGTDWIVGTGKYRWVDEDGHTRHTGTHWDELPETMHRIIMFVPLYPEPPHTQEIHDAMATFEGKFKEALKRCRC